MAPRGEDGGDGLEPLGAESEPRPLASLLALDDLRARQLGQVVADRRLRAADTDTFAGIDPTSVPAFIGAQLVGMALAAALIRALYPDIATIADVVVVPHRIEERT